MSFFGASFAVFSPLCTSKIKVRDMDQNKVLEIHDGTSRKSLLATIKAAYPLLTTRELQPVTIAFPIIKLLVL